MKKNRNQEKHALEQVLSIVGSQSALARLLTTVEQSVKQQNVKWWLETGKLPAEHVLRVEHFTGVSRFELRPDVFCTPKDLKQP